MVTSVAPLVVFHEPCTIVHRLDLYGYEKTALKLNKEMATLRLYLDTRIKRADGTSNIRLAVNHHGGTAYISLNQYCKADEWDKRLCRVRKRPDKDFINEFLLDRLTFYNRMLMRVQCRDDYRGDISARQLRDAILKEASPEKDAPITLRSVFDKYMARDMRPNTRISYVATWHNIEGFCPDADHLPLDEINLDWLERFKGYLAGAGISNNSMVAKFRCLRAVFNYAIDNEFTEKYPFRRFKISIQETPYRDLKVDELRSVISTAGLSEKRQRFVDAFLLSFLLLGINSHDMYNLMPENIVDGRLCYTRLKTGKKYSILLQPEALAMLEKYRGKNKLLSFCEDFKSYGSFVCSMNEALHTIRDGLTSYYARYSWASIAFNLGISKDVVSLALGHSFGVRVTDTYINADLSRVDEANRKVIDYVLHDKK